MKRHYLSTHEKSDCCGCKCCEQACPNMAIEMQDDTEGFWYPIRDAERCKQCNRCLYVCPMHMENVPGKGLYFAAWNRDAKVRDASSSGGIFRPMAHYVIRNGGVVVGASFDSQFIVKHVIIDQEDQILLLQKSKYVQSDTARIYQNIKLLLDSKRTVLFSGTPCQVAGLHSFLAIEYDNLISCSVACYGVPSPMIFAAYKFWLEDKYSSRIVDINFKDKTYGWDYYTTRVEFANGKVYHLFPKDPYARMMMSKLSIRPSCLKCQWHEGCGHEDILLGDCWGIQSLYSDDTPFNGVSKVTVLSDKGKWLFDAIAENTKVTQITTLGETDVYYEEKSSLHDDRREAFFSDIHAKGFLYASNRYFTISIFQRFRYWLNSYRFRIIIILKAFLNTTPTIVM